MVYGKEQKKSYTFELTDKGYSLERITRRVIKKFPDANPKSIQQWYRISLRNKGIDYKTLEKDGHKENKNKSTDNKGI